jgi:hypothetical protein
VEPQHYYFLRAAAIFDDRSDDKDDGLTGETPVLTAAKAVKDFD